MVDNGRAAASPYSVYEKKSILSLRHVYFQLLENYPTMPIFLVQENVPEVVRELLHIYSTL